MTREEKAALDLIAYTEGTLGVSQNGYDVIVTFKTINGWTVDTNIVHGGSDWKQNFGGDYSTAAGRYQFLYDTWLGLHGDKNVPLNKANQDAACVKLINKRLAQNYTSTESVSISELTDRKKFDIFLQKCAPEWASLPLTKDVTVTYKDKQGNKHTVNKKAGNGFYDGQNAKFKADDLYNIYMKAYNLYT